MAPLNPQPQWPGGCIAILRETGAQEKTIPFCVAWVHRFFARHPGHKRRDLGRVETEAFLGETARRAVVSNWQVQQARDSLELYYEQFRGIALAPRPDHVESTVSSPPPFPQMAQPVGGSQNLQDAHTMYAPLHDHVNPQLPPLDEAPRCLLPHRRRSVGLPAIEPQQG